MNVDNEFGRQCGGVLPTDAVALLAGVNFGSVVRVMWAIDAIKSATTMSYEDILNVDRIPKTFPDAERYSVTPVFVEKILSCNLSPSVAAILNTKRRFGI